MVAHVSPRVEGHAIFKPQIEIQRLNPDEIQRLQVILDVKFLIKLLSSLQ
jgi:hypothetical protein